MRKVDLHPEETVLVYAPFWPRDRRLPIEKVVVRGCEGDVAEVLLLQVGNLAVYPLDGGLAAHQYVTG